jgi:hypothetical protein
VDGIAEVLGGAIEGLLHRVHESHPGRALKPQL